MIKQNPLLTILFIICLAVSGSADSLTVIAVGDIMMGSDYPASMLPPEGGAFLYRNVANLLQSADLTVGNLEGVLLSGGTCAKQTARGKVYAFRTPPSFAQHLVNAGFDFMNLANNHLNDFGPGGVESTMRTLDGCGIAYGGPEVLYQIRN